MHTFLNLARPSILYTENVFKATSTPPYGKIAAVALGILTLYGSLIACYLLFRQYQRNKAREIELSRDLNSKTSNFESHQKPSIQTPLNTSTQPPQTVTKSTKNDHLLDDDDMNKDDAGKEQTITTPTNNAQSAQPQPTQEEVKGKMKLVLQDILKIQPATNGVTSSTSQGSSHLNFSATQQTGPQDTSQQVTNPVEIKQPTPTKTDKKPSSLPAPAATLSFSESLHKQIKQICMDVEKNVLSDSSFSTQAAFRKLDLSLSTGVREIFEELVTKFEEKYNIQQHEKIQIGERVTPYFANVVARHQTNIERKYFSLIGIANLIEFGPQIFDDLAKEKFLDGCHHYFHNKGLNLLSEKTGTTFDSYIELSGIKEDKEAIEVAKKLIINFGQKCGIKSPSDRDLKAEEVARKLPNRKLDLPNSNVHCSINNKDRGNCGIWKRETLHSFGEYNYYVNVPNFSMAISGILRLPYMVAEIIAKVKEKNNNELMKDFLNDFFTNGLSDKCINDKTNTFIEFAMNWKKKLSQKVVLTPQEEFKKQIQEGTFQKMMTKKIEKKQLSSDQAFNEVLKTKGIDYLIKNVQTPVKLQNLFDKNAIPLVNDKGETLVDKKGNPLVKEWEETLQETLEEPLRNDKGEILIEQNAQKILYQTEEHWIERYLPQFIQILKKEGLWESALYRDDSKNPSADYFLLDSSSLRVFLKLSYCPSLKANF